MDSLQCVMHSFLGQKITRAYNMLCTLLRAQKLLGSVNGFRPDNLQCVMHSSLDHDIIRDYTVLCTLLRA